MLIHGYVVLVLKRNLRMTWSVHGWDGYTTARYSRAARSSESIRYEIGRVGGFDVSHADPVTHAQLLLYLPDFWGDERQESVDQGNFLKCTKVMRKCVDNTELL